MRNFICLYINGERFEVRGEAAFQPLSSFLRYELGKTGTKVVCAEGDCGACTVLRSHPLDNAGTRFRAMNSCIALVALMDGSHIVTVEGLKQQDGVLTEVQKCMTDFHGGQCGYCTPGFVMALTAMFEKHEQASEKRVKNFLTGNLCRCTGYLPIIEAALNVDPTKLERIRERYGDKAILRNLQALIAEPFTIEDGERRFFGPVSIADAAKIRADDPNLRIFSSATDLGVQYNKEKIAVGRAMSLAAIPELYALEETDTHYVVGAKVDLSSLQDFMESRIPEFSEFLNVFASPQIKNLATLAGNIMNASPIADTLPFLFAMDAEKELISPRGARRVRISEVFQGYKKLAVAPDEVLSRVFIPRLKANQRLRLYKVARRKDLDISCVNAGFLTELDSDGKIQEARLAFGGVAATPVRLKSVEKFLQGKKLAGATLTEAEEEIQHAIQPISDVRGSSDYRSKLCAGLFRKFCEERI